MEYKKFKKVVIVGGGTSGWMAAAAIIKAFEGRLKVELIESDNVATVGVGEATIPPIRSFNEHLGIDEAEFVRETNATYKLGIDFRGWGSKTGDDCYFHPFGSYLDKQQSIHFASYWSKLKQIVPEFNWEEYSLTTVAARNNKFSDCTKAKSFPMKSVGYAYHFDAGLYAKYLRKYSENLGVVRTEGFIKNVTLGSSGEIDKVILESGVEKKGDLYIDCSGFRGLLIEQALKTGYVDWKEYLPCDRAIAVPTERAEELPPYTVASTLSSGWMWRIPLQQRFGNGYVYSSDFLSEDQACDELLKNLENKPIADPKFIKFTTGHRKKLWNKNCVSIGLSSSFIEPLESTSIHLIQSSIHRLIQLMPEMTDFSNAEETFNQDSIKDITYLRDFISLHYRECKRDTPFWSRCGNQLIESDRLRNKITAYRQSSYISCGEEDLFKEESWFAVMEGQGIHAKGATLLSQRLLDLKTLKHQAIEMRTQILQSSKLMSSHEKYLERILKNIENIKCA